ncbi:uncharacterized protein THITE_2132235 [Thermothielavioides terrestris NRRL 8126]|uniref:Uncharacterized protein n=1 Tax=Thermothielavioides terrestris (strain ATCC 38088 / NRRL 8126) TaxID=578455 RepID=G2RDL7_THETT|nr:uncharacterized protein THITE_2132235 [Thermothielavioides terrestris NRRL 8126]AEO70802.1 hypothetical protein THITE_2132235 [Thermothielavioides terrestris NRRL 8126]
MMMAGAAAALLLVVVLVVVLETGYRIWDLLQHPISARFAFALPLPLPRSRSAPRSLPQSGVCWFVWYTARGGSSKKNRDASAGYSFLPLWFTYGRNGIRGRAKGLEASLV